MEKKELATKTEKTVDEIATKLNDLKIKLSQNKTPETKEGVQATLDELDSLNQKIQKQYSKMSETGDKSKSQMSEMEKNIYNSIESFNNAYTKAGSLFKIH